METKSDNTQKFNMFKRFEPKYNQYISALSPLGTPSRLLTIAPSIQSAYNETSPNITRRPTKIPSPWPITPVIGKTNADTAAMPINPTNISVIIRVWDVQCCEARDIRPVNPMTSNGRSVKLFSKGKSGQGEGLTHKVRPRAKPAVLRSLNPTSPCRSPQH